MSHGAAVAAYPQRAGDRRAVRWRFPGVAAIVALAAIAGIGIALIPTAEQWFSAREQAARIGQLTAEAEVGQRQPDSAELDAARAYNDELASGGASVAAGERLPQAAHADGGYHDLLDPSGTGLMARIVIPAIDADLPVYHGTSDAVLREGVGHLEGTALPVGGADTHAVLTGHRGLAEAELFTRLNEIGEGDLFTILIAGEAVSYRVIRTLVVDPDETETLYPVKGQDLVTLVTCTPLGINSQRILVTGKRVTPTPPSAVEVAQAAPAGPGTPWWAIGMAVALLAGGVHVAISGRRRPAQAAPATPAGPAAR